MAEENKKKENSPALEQEESAGAVLAEDAGEVKEGAVKEKSSKGGTKSAKGKKRKKKEKDCYKEKKGVCIQGPYFRTVADNVKG